MLPKNIRILIFTKAGRSIDILEAHQNSEKFKNGEIKPVIMYTGEEFCPNFKIFYHDEYIELEN